MVKRDMKVELVVETTPTPKPRMTQRDKWVKRPIVVRYRKYCDILKAEATEKGYKVPDCGLHIILLIPMAKSWTKKKKKKMNGMPHKQRPDKDNYEKAILDALCDDDGYVWDGRVSKFWTEEGNEKVIFLRDRAVKEKNVKEFVSDL